MLERASQRVSAAVGTNPSCIAQVFLFAIVDSLPGGGNALLNRLLNARMIFSTQMEKFPSGCCNQQLPSLFEEEEK